MLDPRPGNRCGAATVGQTDHQQLVRKTNLTAIHDQPNLLPLFRLTFDPLPGNRFIPFPHHNGRVGQQTAYATSQADQLSRPGNFPCDSAQPYRPALIYSNQQLGKVAYLCYSLPRSYSHNSLNPGMLELFGRHWVTQSRKKVGQNLFYWRSWTDQLFFP